MKQVLLYMGLIVSTSLVAVRDPYAILGRMHTVAGKMRGVAQQRIGNPIGTVPVPSYTNLSQNIRSIGINRGIAMALVDPEIQQGYAEVAQRLQEIETNTQVLGDKLKEVSDHEYEVLKGLGATLDLLQRNLILDNC